MKSEKAKQYIIKHSEKDGDTCHYYVHDSEAFEAVSIAEEEIRQNAIEAYKLTCTWRKKDKCSLITNGNTFVKCKVGLYPDCKKFIELINGKYPKPYIMKKICKIPKGSKYVTAETIDDNITLIFEPNDTGAFLCDITDDLEYIPSPGDLSIFWNKEKPNSAIIAQLNDYNFSEENLFQSSNRLWYNNAIKFRNEEQYDKIIKSNNGK